MPTLSVVIVNYNVRHFLTNCLDSIEKSVKSGFDIETIVIDNHSVDGSVQALRQSYPWVKLIENTQNIGFGKANNQGFSLATGKYILALNPDTILQEDTLLQCWNYMETHLDCGAIGVKMIDGSGAYLPESKRGLPGLWNAFCKFSGLTAWFPHSKLFAGYYMGHLDSDTVHEVEVLCGAFMFCRSTALLPLKGFDEDFFMYGEDIDLSLRMKKAGWKVVYFPATRIIHFKGESSKKASFNYILHFYQSMSIYVGKHYPGWKGAAFRIMIRLAILVTALASYLKHNLVDNLHKLADIGLLIGLQSLLKQAWANWYFDNPDYYANLASLIHTVGTSIIWVFFLWFFGHYDRHWKPKRQWAGILMGTATILIIYSLLPSDLRSSRFLILAGALFALLLTRITQRLRNGLALLIDGKANKHCYLIVANQESAEKIADAISQHENNARIAGYLLPQSVAEYNSQLYLGTLQNIREVVALYKIDNIVFSTDDLPMQSILDLMVHPDKEVRYLMTGSDSSAVIGSQNSTRQGVFYHAESSYRLSQGLYLRLKRGLDIMVALVILLLSPLWMIWRKKQLGLVSSAWNVLMGKNTWLGYASGDEMNDASHFLPSIKRGIFEVKGLVHHPGYFPVLVNIRMANQYYAKHYSPFIDFNLLYDIIR